MWDRLAAWRWNGLELTDDRARSVLLTTDADAVPRADWIENNLRAIDEGAAIVGGHILGDKTEEALLGSYFLRRARRQLHFGRLIDRLSTLIDPIPHDPWPRHSDNTGAISPCELTFTLQLAGCLLCQFAKILRLSARFAVLVIAFAIRWMCEFRSPRVSTDVRREEWLTA